MCYLLLIHRWEYWGGASEVSGELSAVSDESSEIFEESSEISDESSNISPSKSSESVIKLSKNPNADISFLFIVRLRSLGESHQSFSSPGLANVSLLISLQ